MVPPPIVSSLSSEIVGSLSVSPRLELTGMLQRALVQGIGQMDAVELATATLDATNSVIVKFSPALTQAEWTTELGALRELSRIDWDDRRFWVPSLLHSEQSDHGELLCLGPVVAPLPLASCYPVRIIVSPQIVLHCNNSMACITGTFARRTKCYWRV
eukprot:ANDGO_04880.mRNA.1 hypothetical protein